MEEYENSVTMSIAKAADLIHNADYVVALTGAGISVESGIPPFRGPGGIWTKHGEPSMDGWQRFKDDPESYWRRRLNQKKRSGFGTSLIEAEPNLGHKSLAEMENLGFLKAIITQNIDNLHIAAGSKNVHEIHGNMRQLRCITCNSRYLHETFDFSDLPPRCPDCGGVIKGDTVMFGEPIPADVLDRCYREIDYCDCMIIIGTSGVVTPAASFPLIVKKNGGVLIEINPRPTELSLFCDVEIRAESGYALPLLMSKIKKFRS